MLEWLRKLLRSSPPNKEETIRALCKAHQHDPPLERLSVLLKALQDTGYQLDRRELMIRRVGMTQYAFEYLNHELLTTNQSLLEADSLNGVRLRFDFALTSAELPLTDALGNDPVGMVATFTTRALAFTHLISHVNMEDVYPRIESMINKNVAVLEEITLILLRCTR